MSHKRDLVIPIKQRIIHRVSMEINSLFEENPFKLLNYPFPKLIGVYCITQMKDVAD